MRVFLPLLLLPCLASATPAPPVRELFLAGGALAVCSDLAPAACAVEPAATGEVRRASRHRLDAEGIARALDDRLWTHPGAPPPALRQRWLDEAYAKAGDAPMAASAMEDVLAAVCLADDCPEADPARPWSRLIDAERAAVLAALEVPPGAAGAARVRERAHPGLSRSPHGVAVLRDFVAAAATRTTGRPRIAVVTASGIDPMEAVDFYIDVFRELGAEAVWWPIDEAAAAARFELGDCGALPSLRVVRLRLPQRERIYPDLAAYQHDHCRSQPALMLQVQGVFFAGGDQWRHRRALVHPDGRPNDWLIELREAHARGRVVVGGTSAGAAVQSGAWMLGNGTPEAAVARPARVAPPPEPGCARGHRCGDVPGDALALWPQGGLRLAAEAIVDTHFSERARELRLLMAMQAADARWGYGADETSALRIRESAGRREIEAVGASGGWVFRRTTGLRDAVEAWYLAPGATLVVEGDAARGDEHVALRVAEGTRSATRQRTPLPASAFDAGALRTVAQRLAWRCGAGVDLPSPPGRVHLRCGDGAVGWRGANGVHGVGPMRLHYVRDTPAPVALPSVPSR